MLRCCGAAVLRCCGAAVLRCCVAFLPALGLLPLPSPFAVGSLLSHIASAFRLTAPSLSTHHALQVCSDFDSEKGSAAYPSRNCEVDDARWAMAPSSLSAPCCENATLVRASVAMMTESLAYGITTLPLGQLLSGGSDNTYSSAE